MNGNYVQDHNRFIKGIFSQIKDDGLSEDLIHNLCVELKFAMMNNIDYRGAPIHLERDEKFYLILYTSFDEFEKHFPEESAHSHTSFEWYLETLNAPVYFYISSNGNDIRPCDKLKAPDGIIFDMYGDEFLLEGELLEKVRKFFKIDLCSIDELQDLFENPNNSRLEDLLEDYPINWDEIIAEIGNSSLWVLMSLSRDSDHVGYQGLFNIFEDNPFSYVENISLFTSNRLENQFALTVSFKSTVDYVLSFGLSGLTINSRGENVFLSRELLVEKYDLIERYCDNKRFKRSYQCLFDLWR